MRSALPPPFCSPPGWRVLCSRRGDRGGGNFNPFLRFSRPSLSSDNSYQRIQLLRASGFQPLSLRGGSQCCNKVLVLPPEPSVGGGRRGLTSRSSTESTSSGLYSRLSNLSRRSSMMGSGGNPEEPLTLSRTSRREDLDGCSLDAVKQNTKGSFLLVQSILMNLYDLKETLSNCLDSLSCSAIFNVPQKGVRKRGQVTFFCFGHLLVIILSLFLTLLVTFLPIRFCLPPFAAG